MQTETFETPALAAASVALAVPDPALVQRIANIPQGWAINTFAHAADVATWEDLDEAEERIKGWDSFINSFQGDLLELRRAWRIIEFRRGVLLGTDVTAGERTDLSARGKVLDISPTRAAMCRKFARYPEVFWKHIQEATEPRQLSQRAVEEVIDEFRQQEAGPERSGKSSSQLGDPSKSTAGGRFDGETTTAATAAVDPADEFGFDLGKEMDGLQSQVNQLRAERDSLQASDKDAEISRLHERIARMEGHQMREQNKALERERIIKGQRRTLEQAANLLGVSSFTEIVPAIQDLMR